MNGSMSKKWQHKIGHQIKTEFATTLPHSWHPTV